MAVYSLTLFVHKSWSQAECLPEVSQKQRNDLAYNKCITSAVSEGLSIPVVGGLLGVPAYHERSKVFRW